MNEPVHISADILAGFSQLRLLDSLGLLVPELILTFTILAVVVYDMFQARRDSFKSGLVALMGTGGALLALLHGGHGGEPASAFMGAFLADGLSYFLRMLFLGATFGVVLISLVSADIDRFRQGEYYAVLLTATLAMNLLVGAGSVVVFFLALETLSLCSYALTGFIKGTRPAAEASVKYLLYGTLASSVLLFGFSYLYGLSGTLDFPAVVSGAYASGFTTAASMGLLLVLVGLFFKTSVAPFHIWTPDIYQGAPTPITGYLSVASKGAGFAALVRVVAPVIDLPALNAFPGEAVASLAGLTIDLPVIFSLLAIVTMTIGNFAALRQESLKRLIAYSSIAHAGYMLLVFTNLNDATVQALLAYLAVYLFMNLGFFLCIVAIENDLGSDRMGAIAGYGRLNPLMGICATVILFSLVGLPPTAGFIAKYQLFYAVMGDGAGGLDPWRTLLVLIALLNSVVSLAYYIRPAKLLFFSEPPTTDRPSLAALPVGARPSYAALMTIVLLGLTLPLFGLFFRWSDVLAATSVAFGAVGLP